MTVTWLLATVMVDNKIDDANKSRKNTGNFNHHGDAAVQCGAHLPIKHIQGFTWMVPLGKCLRRIAPATAMVEDIECNTKTLTKHNF
jgi:hypothetical protein